MVNKEEEEEQKKIEETDALDTRNIFQKVSDSISCSLEIFFYRLGKIDAKYPWWVIFFCLVGCGICMSGWSQFYVENRAEELFIPSDSRAIEEFQIYQEIFPSNSRLNSVIMTGKGCVEEGGDCDTNLLEKDLLLEILDFFLLIADVEATVDIDEYTYQELCFKPFANICLRISIFNAWNYNPAILEADPDPLATLNFVEDPAETYKGSLSGMEFDGNGNLVSAEALKLLFLLEDNSFVDNGNVVDPPAENWEIEFIDLVNEFESDNMDAYVRAAYSRNQVIGEAINGDVVILTSGLFLIIIYCCIMLGSFSRVYSRVGLALLGVASVGFAIISTIGLSSYFGQFYGPVHSVLPFILLGIGVDDMFVIHDAFRATPENLSLIERTALGLSHAGVSVTVTSLTDFVAFLIGFTTSLPALSSFCVYAALGILILYFLQITWFTAWLSIDSRRMKSHRVDCFCCIVSKKYASRGEVELKPSKMSLFLEFTFTPFILRKWFAIFLAVIFFSLSAFGIYCVGWSLQIASTEVLLVPADSYLSDTIEAETVYFPVNSAQVFIVTGDIDYVKHQQDFLDLREPVTETEGIDPTTYSSWYEAFYIWNNSTFVADDDEFYSKLNTFIGGLEGVAYQQDLSFSDETQTRLVGAQFRVTSVLLNTTNEQIDFMKTIRATIDAVEDPPMFAFSYSFLDIEQFAVLQVELYQNSGLTLLCVLIITLILVANPITAFFIFLCVAMVILDTFVVFYIAGIDLDAVVIVQLVLAVGLAVDYSAHVGHSFMVATGDNYERLCRAMGGIGPSVLNGAFSTFLAVLLLAFSQSYIFFIFFVQFTATVVFGVLHGMVLLPILLWAVGPPPYKGVHVHQQEEDFEKKAPEDIEMVEGQRASQRASRMSHKNPQPEEVPGLLQDTTPVGGATTDGDSQ
eukprot:Lithocolla_globosa_v1_NODE_847_length_3192_cov_9.743067.p1 type:complete len:916 gc:universal NODE_847_length_3192_cov_9.743067:339-3086(+)